MGTPVSAPRWEERIRTDPAVRPRPRTDQQADVLTLLEEATTRLRDAEQHHAQMLDYAIGLGTPLAAVALSAGMTYDQLRMRLQRQRART